MGGVMGRIIAGVGVRVRGQESGNALRGVPGTRARRPLNDGWTTIAGW